jgi:hypothetical protein
MVPGAPIMALAMEGPTAASIRSSSAWRHFPETAVIAREVNFTAAERTPEPGSKRRVLALSLVDDWIRLKSADS